jgi:putative acetyltransferase
MTITYRHAEPEDMAAVRSLFTEYAGSLGIDLSFQGFDGELEGLPGKYSPPDGTLLIAERDGEPCGCIALRRIDARACEMKRLYVRPVCRGLGIGRELVSKLLEEARTKGYSSMRLDTLPSMRSAIAMYRSFGFREIAPYIYNPVEGALFMEKILRPGEQRGDQ